MLRLFNGDSELDDGRLRHSLRCAGDNVKPHKEDAPASETHQFSANETVAFGMHLAMSVPVYALGLGSTGSIVVHLLASLVRREVGRLPTCFEYLMIDTASPRAGMDLSHYRKIGVDGIGTLASLGRERFMENYEELKDTVRSQVEGLFGNDTDLKPATQPRDAVDFWIFAAPGGTGTGATQSSITLLHHVAQDRRIQDPRVHVVPVGAEICLRDRSRRPIPEQLQVVRDNAAITMIKIAADMANPGFIHETVPPGTIVSTKASQRVHAVCHVDQSNGQAEFTTIAALAEMIAHSAFVRMFTFTGHHVSERARDNDELGAVRHKE